MVHHSNTNTTAPSIWVILFTLLSFLLPIVLSFSTLILTLTQSIVHHGNTDTFQLDEPPLPLLAHPLPSKPLPPTLAHLCESISSQVPLIIVWSKSSDARSMGKQCQLKWDASCIWAVLSINSSRASCTMTAHISFVACHPWYMTLCKKEVR